MKFDIEGRLPGLNEMIDAINKKTEPVKVICQFRVSFLSVTCQFRCGIMIIIELLSQ